jgi:NitT/TauT family transport system substrate-binding protein
MPMMQTRRRFLTGLSLVGAAGLIGTPRVPAADGSLETATIRLAKTPPICLAPQYVADELLRVEGFTDVRYVSVTPPTSQAIADGTVDFSMGFASALVTGIDRGQPITVLSGVHVGCFELFGSERIRSIIDLKGKDVGVEALGASEHLFVSVMAANVGLDPVKDIHWVASRSPPLIELFADGKVDAVLGFPPQPQELRARHLGHVIVNSAVDRPWSQYYCCLLAGNREFVRTHPVATKRVLRAILKAADLCATEPAGVARQLVDRNFTDRYDYTVEELRGIPYDKWREYDSEDTVRFYALRLHEAGMIKSSPQKIIADGTDWRFLDEIKRELKA